MRIDIRRNGPGVETATKTIAEAMAKNGEIVTVDSRRILKRKGKWTPVDFDFPV